MKFALGQKLAMSQIFDEEGRARAVTLVRVDPMTVTQIKTKEKDGYEAVQVASGTKKHPTKPLQGHIKKAGLTTARWFREFRLDANRPLRQSSSEASGSQIAEESKANAISDKPRLPPARQSHSGGDGQELAIGNTIDASIFAKGDRVRVSGTVKGRGFQGVVKRHGFHGAPATHGTKHAHREPGSVGATWPQRIIKGKRMAGRMGGNRVTIKNLTIADVLPEKPASPDGKSGGKLLVLTGAVPGHRGSFLEIKGK